MASKMAARVGVEPTRRGSKPRVPPLDYRAILLEHHAGPETAPEPWKGPVWCITAVKRRGSRAPRGTLVNRGVGKSI